MADKSSDKQQGCAVPVTLSGSGSANYTVKGEEYQVTIVRPTPSVSVHELKISLDRNREMLDQSASDMLKLKPCKKKVDDLRSPTRNALLARANIDLLIPLINIKGGEASYKGKEALLIEKHIEKLRDDAAKKVDKQIEKDKSKCFWIDFKQNQVNNPLIIIMFIVILTMTFLFLSYLFGFLDN